MPSTKLNRLRPVEIVSKHCGQYLVRFQNVDHNLVLVARETLEQIMAKEECAALFEAYKGRVDLDEASRKSLKVVVGARKQRRLRPRASRRRPSKSCKPLGGQARKMYSRACKMENVSTED